MKTILISIPVGIVLAETILRIFTGKWLCGQLKKMRNLPLTFMKTLGDDERQAFMLSSGLMLIQFGSVMMAILGALSLIAYLPTWPLEFNNIESVSYTISLSIVAIIWIIFRKKVSSLKNIKAYSSYSMIDCWLHWLALETSFIRHMSFDLERLFFLDRKNLSSEDYINQSLLTPDAAVYVCGLARSGTTILLHILDEIDVFRSLTYRDMPFVLAPKLWNKVTQHSKNSSPHKERAHGDGLMVNFDSPEGFEEVFWQTFSNYQRNNKFLSAGYPSPKNLANFADYRKMVVNSKSSSSKKPRRYLSKNNNNLLRLESLSSNPTATILLVYRNPIATARSLFSQHQLFSASQTADSFTRKYMGWLAHYEFGLDHHPFAFAEQEMDSTLKPDNPNYWLSYWNAVYLYVLTQSNCRFYLVNYDELCLDPERMLKSIFSGIQVEANASILAKKIKAHPSKIQKPDEFYPELLRQAQATYSALQSSSKNITLKPH